MRREDDLITFARKILECDAYQFHRLRVQKEFWRIDEQKGSAQIMIVMVPFDLIQVAYECHLNRTFGTGSHRMNVAFKTVVFVEDVQLGRRKERGKARGRNVEPHVDRGEQRAELLIQTAFKQFEFFGAAIALSIEQGSELLDQFVEFSAQPALEGLKNFVEKLGKSLVSFKIPNLDLILALIPKM